MPGLVVRPGEGQQRGGASPAAWGGCPGPRQVRGLMSGPGCGRAGAPALATGSLDGRPEPKPAGPDLSRWPFGGSFDDLDVGARNLCRPLARASESPAGCRGAPGRRLSQALPRSLHQAPRSLPATRCHWTLSGEVTSLVGSQPSACQAAALPTHQDRGLPGGSFPGSGPVWRAQRLRTSRSARSGQPPELVCDCPPLSASVRRPPAPHLPYGCRSVGAGLDLFSQRSWATGWALAFTASPPPCSWSSAGSQAWGQVLQGSGEWNRGESRSPHLAHHGGLPSGWGAGRRQV